MGMFDMVDLDAIFGTDNRPRPPQGSPPELRSLSKRQELVDKKRTEEFRRNNTVEQKILSYLLGGNIKPSELEKNAFDEADSKALGFALELEDAQKDLALSKDKKNLRNVINSGGAQGVFFDGLGFL